MSRLLPANSNQHLRRKLFIGGTAAMLAGGLAACFFWQRISHPPADSTSASASAPVVDAQDRVFAGYAGSASCRECHSDAYAEWAKSNHGLAERVLDAMAVPAAFQPAKSFTHGSQTTEAGLRDGKPAVTTLGLSGQRETHPVERAIGHDPLVQFLVSAPGGRLQTLEASYDPRSNQWFNVFGDDDRKPGEWGHWTGRGMNWNSMCAACHNTRLRKNYEAASDSYHTAMAEMSVGCEACHGPEKAHVEWQHRYAKSGKKDPTLAKLKPAQMLDTCGACHSRRAELTGDFKPGDDFFDHHDLEMVDGSEHYYPDGQVHDEDYEYASFLSSRMRAGGVNCQDCHQPHSAKLRLPGNLLCVRCHNGSYPKAPVIDPVAHSHHQVRGYDAAGRLVETNLVKYAVKDFKETGGECINCHMPQTAYMQRHLRHDHGFTIPDPLLTKQHDIPNACNHCHQDKDADWALAATEKWYGSRMEHPRRARAQTLARARSGDATAVDPLLKLLASGETSFWKTAAINLLAPWSENPKVQTALLQSFNDTNALVRTKAVRVLSAGEPAEPVTTAVRARLEDPVRSVRVAAAWALRASLEMTNRAARELELFMAQSADQPAGQMQLGAFFASRNELPKALEHYRQAVAGDTNSAPIRHELAMIYSLLNRNGEALEQLRAAVRLDPRDAEYRYKLALAWNEAGDLDATISELEQAVRLNPRYARAWYNLGLARAAKNDSAEALAALANAEKISADDPNIPYARATILAQLGRNVEARAAAKRALEIRPGFSPARELLQALPR